MINKNINKFIGLTVFLISTIVLFLTVQPSVSFWDPGEISASTFSLMVPHPPGGPLWLIVGRLFSMIPFANNIGLRINTLSVIAGSFSVLLLYLCSVKIIETYRGNKYKSKTDALITYTSAAIGALAFSFCDTFWFNAVESNYFSVSTFLFALVVWLMMIWNEKSNDLGNERYIVLAAFLTGLAFGVHLMSVLAIFTFVFVIVMKKYAVDEETFKKTAYIFTAHIVILIIIALGLWSSETSTTPPTHEQFNAFDYKFVWIMIGVSFLFIAIFRKKIFNRSSFYFPIIIAGAALFLTYPGMVKGLTALLLFIGEDSIITNVIFLVVIFLLIFYLILWSGKKGKGTVNLIAVSLLFMLLGFSTYTMIIIRANQNPPINENAPKNFPKLMYYLDRQQYGDFPIFKRRFSSEPNQQGIYTKYSSDLDFFWNYQMNHMFNRYLAWNFIGKTSTNQDAPASLNQLFGIPFLMGLIGLYFLFRKNWKIASAWLILFIFMGYLTAFYQNQQEPQVRDRFYFYPGSLFVFAAWIAIGVREIIELVPKGFILIRTRIKNTNFVNAAIFACLGVFIILIPGNMLRTNYLTHDRSKNWLPWDFAYNLLQSCAPNAILFTGGDNDTFPVWYLQNVEYVRRDVRMVCLSLANTDWYVLNLKNTTPFKSQKVKFSLSDDSIDHYMNYFMEWHPHKESIPVTKEIIQKFNIKDSTIINNGSISWVMNPTMDYGSVSGIRFQDIVVKDIVENNLWDRPIYFASSCSRDSYIGLDDYLQEEGIAYRLVPQKNSTGMNINVAATMDNLFNENTAYSISYKTGFKFRGLNNKNIFYDDTETGLVQNYRKTFLDLAYYFHTNLNNDTLCLKTLNVMENKIPRSVIHMDFRILYYLANLYYMAGALDKYKELSNEMIPNMMNNLDNTSEEDITSPFNPYRVLERIYLNLKEYDKAIEILQRLQNNFPNTAGLQEEMDRIKLLAQGK